MIVRFGLSDDIYWKIFTDDAGALGCIGNAVKLEDLAHSFAAAFDAIGGTTNTEILLAHMLDRLSDKKPGRVWAEGVEPGPNAYAHPMTEYLLRTGRLHPDYYDDYFSC